MCAAGADVIAEIADRASAGCVWSGGRGGDAGSDATFAIAADNQPGSAGPGLRPGLCSAGGSECGDRARDLQLHRIRVEEFGAGTEESLEIVEQVEDPLL